MKKAFLLSIFVTVMAYLPVSGQSFEDLNKEYLRMKNRPVPAGKVSTKPIIMVAAAARNSDGNIKISFLSDAHEILSNLTVQPLILLNGTEGRQPGDKAGEITSISLKGSKADEALANPVVIIAADAAVNAIEVRFVIGAAENEQRLLIPLKDEPEIVAVRFIE